MAVVNHSATINGVDDFLDLEGNTVSWNGSDYIEFVGMWPDPNDTVTSDLTLNGNNWHIETLRYHSTTDFTNITDANGNGGREITYVRLGMNSDVDLISTRFKYIETHSGGALHDVTLGSADTESVNLNADSNILVGGSGWTRSIRTDGDDTVTINSGGAGNVDVGDGINHVTVQDDSHVDVLKAHDGDNTITVRDGSRIQLLEANRAENDITVTGDSEIKTLSLHNSTSSIDVQGNSKIVFFQTSESVNTLDTDMRWFGFMDSWNATNTINIGSGGAGGLNISADRFFLQTISATGYVSSIRVNDDQRTILTLGDGGAGSVRLGDRGDTVTTDGGFVDFLRTDDGNDTVSIGVGGAHSVRLDDGNDRLTTSTGFVDNINGGNGNDIINIGTGGTRIVSGGSGNDRVNLSETSFGFVMNGGSDTDLLDFRSFSSGIAFSLNTPDVQNPVAVGPGYIAFGFENLTGTFQNDRLTGSSDANRIEALAGNDTVFGFAGNDTLLGRNGNDALNGNQGNDTLRGHNGDDTLLGQQGNDRLEGGNGRDLLDGGNLHDFLAGGNANDTLRGGNGNDRLFGGNQNDRLFGGNGNDTVAGGNGNDTLNGGAGTDEFQFAANAGTDLVEDFQDGSDILHIFGHAGGFGTLNFSDVGADLHVVHDGGTIVLEGLAGTSLSQADFDFT